MSINTLTATTSMAAINTMVDNRNRSRRWMASRAKKPRPGQAKTFSTTTVKPASARVISQPDRVRICTPAFLSECLATTLAQREVLELEAFDGPFEPPGAGSEDARVDLKLLEYELRDALASRGTEEAEARLAQRLQRPPVERAPLRLTSPAGPSFLRLLGIEVLQVGLARILEELRDVAHAQRARVPPRC